MTLPSQLGLQALVRVVLAKEPRRFHKLKRKQRSTHDDGDQVVGIERDARHQDLELVGIQRFRRCRLRAFRGDLLLADGWREGARKGCKDERHGQGRK